MHSDHRTLHFRLPETTHQKRKDGHHQQKRGQGPWGVRRASGRNREQHRTLKHAQPRQMVCGNSQYNEGEDAKAKNRTGPKNQRVNHEKNSNAEIARRQSKKRTYPINQKHLQNGHKKQEKRKPSKKRSPDTPTGQRRLMNYG